MSERNDGGRVFPGAEQQQSGELINAYGMSLRDWFAGHAMGALMSTAPQMLPEQRRDLDNLAAYAYVIADALLAHRQKGDA